MKIEKLIRDYIFTTKGQQEVVLVKDQDILEPFLIEFICGMVSLSGGQLTEQEVVSKLEKLQSIRFSSFSKSKRTHDIAISLEEETHSIYQLNLGLVEEVCNHKDGLPLLNKHRVWEEDSCCYQGLMRAMADRIIQHSYPNFNVDRRGDSSFWAQSQIMGVLIDVIGQDVFITGMVRNPAAFLRQLHHITYQEEPLPQYLERRLLLEKQPTDITTLISNEEVVACAEAINDSRQQLSKRFVKYK